ncbi:lymphotoxin-alpha isoform X2 [Puntigrus tetrazona]|uniref:lymphotoxin-alpha isoform X2 n=1 Tax=Puntigrus tetrazona TaxID=1606681 RepID=UPI001C8A64F6|nr:lymphotoxin-alpha isoform X2 [Puntigrus tetrazona]
MTSANHPRFRLLIGWCCLMSSALLILIVCFAINRKDKPENEAERKEQNFTVTDGKTDQRIGLYPVQSVSDYIHLIRDSKEIWICHPWSVTLLKNKALGIQERYLSRVKHSGSGTATMICLVELTEGDSISLEIHPNKSISSNEYDTYWEIMFLNNK